jgi:hypothetical protein
LISPEEAIPGGNETGSLPGVRAIAEVALLADAPAARLLLDDTAPSPIYLALAAEQPPGLWIPIGRHADEATQALVPYRPLDDKTPAPLALPRTVRGFIGHSETLGYGLADLEQRLARHPALAAGSWGSAYATDPWPRPLSADLPAATRALLAQRYAAQSPVRPRSLTFVTRWSRSLVALEDHGGALVLALTYAPTAGVRAAGSRPLPTDLPSDARWAVQELPFADAAMLDEWLWAAGSPPPPLPDRVTLLLGLAAVWHADLRLHTLLRRISRQSADWALRAAAIAVAQRQGYLLLLHELCAGETDPELRAELEARTALAAANEAEAAP